MHTASFFFLRVFVVHLKRFDHLDGRHVMLVCVVLGDFQCCILETRNIGAALTSSVKASRYEIFMNRRKMTFKTYWLACGRFFGGVGCDCVRFSHWNVWLMLRNFRLCNSKSHGKPGKQRSMALWPLTQCLRGHTSARAEICYFKQQAYLFDPHCFSDARFCSGSHYVSGFQRVWTCHNGTLWKKRLCVFHWKLLRPWIWEQSAWD